MSNILGTDIQQIVVSMLEAKKEGDTVNLKRLAKELIDISLTVGSTDNSVGVGNLELFYPEAVYEMSGNRVIVSEHSHAHSNELSKNNVKFLLVNATLMAFRYYSKELIEGFSSFGEKVKSKGDASHVLHESIINDGAFYPRGLYEACLSGSGAGLKLIESKFKTNPVVL